MSNLGEFGLLPQHAQLVEGSAISPEVARSRGYESIERKADLLAKGFAEGQVNLPGLLIPIRGVTGEIECYQFRPDSPRIKDDKPVKYENPLGGRIVLDIHPHICNKLADRSATLWITEGARKVDAAISQGLCCIGLLGVWGWCRKDGSGKRAPLPDWDEIDLNGRKVFIAFDSDVTEKKEVQIALRGLAEFLRSRKAEVWIVFIPSPTGEKVGLDDFFADGRSPLDLLTHAVVDREEPTKEKRTLVSMAIDLCGEVELFRSLEDAAYARIPVGNHFENHLLPGAEFKKWLRHRFFETYGTPINQRALDEAAEHLEALALVKGQKMPVAIRIGHFGGKKYLDLANENWDVIEISGDRWIACPNPPIRFVRVAGMLPLPSPKSGGSLEDLRKFINVQQDDDFALIAGFLVGAYMSPEYSSFPSLILTGEQGVAKSTSARILHTIIDPRKPLLRRIGSLQDTLLAASKSRVLAFDNISKLTQAQSDLFCQLATGGGEATRKLYTNGEEFIVDAKLPIILTGIEDLAKAPDLADRALFPKLSRITSRIRKTDIQIWTEFEAALPSILGWLLDSVSAAMRNLDKIKVEELPRMADFYLWVLAAESNFGRYEGAFKRAFAVSSSSARDVALESSQIGSAVVKLFAEDKITKEEFSPSDLYDLILNVTPEAERRNLPKVEKLRGELRKVAPLLRELGIECDCDPKRKSGYKPIRLYGIPATTATGTTTATANPLRIEEMEADDGASGSSGGTAGEWQDMEDWRNERAVAEGH